MQDKEIELKINDLNHEIKGIKKTLIEVKENQAHMNSLTVSVKEQTLNIKYMVDELKEQNERLKALEKEPLETIKYYKRLLLGTMITALASGCVALFLGLFHK